MAYQRRTRLTVGDRVKGCQAVLFGQGPNGFLAAKDAAIKPKDLEGKDRETAPSLLSKTRFLSFKSDFYGKDSHSSNQIQPCHAVFSLRTRYSASIRLCQGGGRNREFSISID